MSLRSMFLVPGLISAVFAAGCGGSAESLVPVSGTLLVDGKPMDGVDVTFVPEGAKNGRGGFGKTDEAGEFTVTDIAQNLPGLAAGKYVVAYSRRRLPDGSAAPEPVGGQPINPGIIQVETFPKHLLAPNPKVPANQVDIPEEGTSSLELKISKKKAAGMGAGMMGPG